MHAKDFALEAVLSQRQQWVVPVYQRHYAWLTRRDKQLPKIWADTQQRAEEVIDGKDLSPHFLGAIIYSEPKSQQKFGTVQVRHIVDGQQRITTSKLLLCAIKEIACEEEISSIENSISAYLFNPKEAAMADPDREFHKLWLSSNDRKFYASISEGGEPLVIEKNPTLFRKNGNLIVRDAPKIVVAYWFLKQEIRTFLEEKKSECHEAITVLEAILRGILEGFQLVVVQLEDQDDPQLIYASLNGNAEPLSAFDLIRNDIFHRARKQNEDEEELYEGRWKKLETGYWEKSVKHGRIKRPRTDHLISHTLVAEKASEINVGRVANEYQHYAREQQFDSVQEEIESLLQYAGVYKSLETFEEGKPEYRISKFLRTWEISVFHPLVMWVGKQDIADDEKQGIYDTIESYIVRRDVCGLTRKRFNFVVPSILRSLKDSEEDSVRSRVEQILLSFGASIDKFPRDAEVISHSTSVNAYDELRSARLKYIFSEVEHEIRSEYSEPEPFELKKLTVEHIMPRRWAENWPLTDGTKCKQENYWDTPTPVLIGSSSQDDVTQKIEERQKLIHTLGNLTVITGALNSSSGNEGWNKKKAQLKERSIWLLNRQLCDEGKWKEWDPDLKSSEGWNEDTIIARGRFIAKKINKLWPLPND